MSQSTKTALSVVAVIVLAGAFWMLLLAPKREKASELAEQTTSLSSEVASEQARANAAVVAKRKFPQNYQQLVVLGTAVPAEAATPSLLVQLNGVSAHAETSFQSIALGGGEGSGASGTASATEGAAALQPLGATVGPAELLAMPYALESEGGFFDIADFIHGLDSLVKTKGGEVDAHGRLITIDGFNLTPVGGEDAGAEGSSAAELKASLNVTTYVAPPGQGLTAGATAAGPSPTTTPNLP